MRTFLLPSLLLCALTLAAAQAAVSAPAADSDHDGLSDTVENALLKQFQPQFMVSDDDCSSKPAQFVRYVAVPAVEADNGTIYGQATPRAGHAGQVELHYYHLWRRDCGELSHNLDVEHVSLLLEKNAKGKWQALYWYAAAHEDTVCDDSQIARASTIDAVDHGARIWISRGKHASFLASAICSHGCGGDVCREMKPLSVTRLINLGELSAPMNGSTWNSSPKWPLASKLSRSDFLLSRLTHLNELPATAIAWANPGKRPMQAIIHGGNSAMEGTAVGLRSTGMALDLANTKTGNALNTASDSTGNALGKTFRNVGKALRITARKVGKALGAK